MGRVGGFGLMYLMTYTVCPSIRPHCLKREIEVVERVKLEEKDGWTIVTKDVIVTNSGVPWFFVPLIWFITRFGKPSGKDKLKELCEGGS
jgi:hypothetical protein